MILKDAKKYVEEKYVNRYQRMINLDKNRTFVFGYTYNYSWFKEFNSGNLGKDIQAVLDNNKNNEKIIFVLIKINRLLAWIWAIN